MYMHECVWDESRLCAVCVNMCVLECMNEHNLNVKLQKITKTYSEFRRFTWNRTVERTWFYGTVEKNYYYF